MNDQTSKTTTETPANSKPLSMNGHIRLLSVVPVELEQLLKELKEELED